MNLYFKEKEAKTNNNNILSATKRREPILDLNYNTNNQLQNKLKQKKIIKIFVDDNKYFVEHSTAFALKIINTRAVMTDKLKLVEISYDMYNRLKSNDEIEIEYIKVGKKEKLSLKVYYDGNNYYIDNSAAYTLGLLDVDSFYNNDIEYHYIDEDILNYLKQQFNVEIYSLNLANEKSSLKK